MPIRFVPLAMPGLLDHRAGSTPAAEESEPQLDFSI
jgi:hypothetical protein